MPLLPFTPGVIASTAEILLRGGVVIVPTDTVYGIACHPQFPDALERIRQLKHREAHKPFQLLAADTASVWADGARRTPNAEKLSAYWPGALTLVLPRREGKDEGYRVPDNALLRELLRQCGGLLRCTSVNLSGEAPAANAQEAMRTLGANVDRVLDGGAARLGVASTVVRLSEAGEPTVLRQGALVIPALGTLLV